MQEIKKRKMDEYKMQLAISQNPHLEPTQQKVLWKELNREDRLPTGDSFDEAAFDRLKEVMAQGGSFVIKE